MHAPQHLVPIHKVVLERYGNMHKQQAYDGPVERQVCRQQTVMGVKDSSEYYKSLE